MQINDLQFYDKEAVLVYIFCIENGISPKRFVSLHSKDLMTLKQHKLIEKDYKTNSLITKRTRSKNAIAQEVINRIDEYQHFFSKTYCGLSGRKGPKSDCIKKLTKFLEENKEYTFDDVLRVAKYYVDNYHQISTYLQRANYFIKKNGDSRLEELLSEVNDKHDVVGYGDEIV